VAEDVATELAIAVRQMTEVMAVKRALAEEQAEVLEPVMEHAMELTGLL